ncbi:MAG: relaxase/mobilization nuclease domain-containing protein [Alphaproteobacteria bacterium]
MIIKSHIRGGFRSAADYLKSQGLNEKIRTVDISDPDAKTLDEAFQNMWAVASNTKARKPLHHISINPFKDERLTDKQVLKIVERCEQKYGYSPNEHQRVIVEHIKDGRQHFHVMWNRVSLKTGKAVWPGHHWNKSKQVAREMEKELGLKRVIPKRIKRARFGAVRHDRKPKQARRYENLSPEPVQRFKKQHEDKTTKLKTTNLRLMGFRLPPKHAFYPAMRAVTKRRRRIDENIPDSEKLPFKRPEWESAQIIAWAFENGRLDILAQYGFDFSTDIDL